MAGCQCNVIMFNSNAVTRHSLDEMSLEYMNFHALGFKSENKGSSTHTRLGRLCYLQVKINIPNFTDLLQTLNDILT